MKDILTQLNKSYIINQIIKICNLLNKEIYLVGGYLRNLILGFDFGEKIDLDFTVKDGALNLAKRIAREIGGKFVLLNEDFNTARIVLNIKGKEFMPLEQSSPISPVRNPTELTLDFSDFKGTDLYKDLSMRDFTINSLALEIGKIKKAHNLEDILLDYFGGLNDLKKEKIKVINELSFQYDPLRILRGISLSCQLKFRISRKTLSLMKMHSNGLKDISGERISGELFKVLNAKNSYTFIKIMSDYKILEAIFPELIVLKNIQQGPYHSLDVYNHSLKTFQEFELLLSSLDLHVYSANEKLSEYLNLNLRDKRKRSSTIKLSCLFHDIGKPACMKIEKDGKLKFWGHEKLSKELAVEISRRIKLSKAEIDCLKKLVYFHLRPGYLVDDEKRTQRSVFRFFRDAGEDAPGLLLLSIADKRATRGPLITEESVSSHQKVLLELLKDYFLKKDEVLPPRLINGVELMKALNIEEGPLVGKLLNEIQIAQTEKKIKTKHEAIKLAKKLFK